ncbi:microsomal signal peptidase 12kDa subunit [Mycena pura]|uniref:Signal peptidase complex subunit 1 n=1 Tax=Mycena pura TaxID=153505 RepID=A0AAD7E4C0_9AGAR|nr:microsomal signal peptidase 12kDa subunit [Mycena pura]
MSSLLPGFPEGRIDFVGQQRVDRISRVWLISTTVISFIVGFALQSLQITFGIFSASTLLLALAVVPPWPLFNRHPTQWLPIRPSPPKKD